MPVNGSPSAVGWSLERRRWSDLDVRLVRWYGPDQSDTGGITSMSERRSTFIAGGVTPEARRVTSTILPQFPSAEVIDEGRTLYEVAGDEWINTLKAESKRQRWLLQAIVADRS